MLQLHYAQVKISKFKEDIKNEKNFEKKLNYLIKDEFDVTLNDILLLEPDSFIERIEKGISISLENIYSEECLSDPKLIAINEKLINNIKLEYSTIAQQLKDSWNTYEKYLKRRPHQDSLLSNFRKHCFNTNDLALHNCGGVNSYFLIVKNKDNKINFVICESCKKVYYSSFICCRCNFCNIDYYSSVLQKDENPNYLLATWENYHCPQIISEKMKCIKCREFFYLDMKNGMLTCLNKKCRFISKPSRILWTCSTCQEEFKSNAIPYNPLDIKVVKKAIRQTLLLKHRAHPKKMPCCKLNVFFTEFFHKKACRGILYEGELNDNMIIVCDKCHAINLYERFIWTCPQCLKKFRDINKDENNKITVNRCSDKYLNSINDNNNNNNDIHKNSVSQSKYSSSNNHNNNDNDFDKNNKYNGFINYNNNVKNKKKEKSRSACKEIVNYKYKFNNSEKDLKVGYRKEIKTINDENAVKNFINSIDEKIEEKKYDMKLKYESPRRYFFKREDKSSKINPTESQKEKCFKILIKNEVVENINENINKSNKNQNRINIYNYKFERRSNKSGEKNEIKKNILNIEKNKEIKNAPAVKNIFRKRSENISKKEKEFNFDNYLKEKKNRDYSGYVKKDNEVPNRRSYYKNLEMDENDKVKNEEDNIQKLIEEENKIISRKNILNMNNINNFQKNDDIVKKNKLRKYVSAQNFNFKNDEAQKNSSINSNIINNIISDDPKSSQKYIKYGRYSSVDNERLNNGVKEQEEKENNDNQNLRTKSRNNYCYHVISDSKKTTIENETKEVNNNNHRVRFHVKMNESKEENKNEIKPKKFIRYRITSPKNEENEEAESEDVKIEDEEEEDNKNNKDCISPKAKENENEEKKVFRRFRIHKNIEKTIGKEDKEDSNNQNNKKFNMNYDLYNNNVNNSNSNNNNVHNIKNIKSESKDDICSSVPENVGIKNLVGLTGKLLNHMKRRINNIFTKMKIPIFNIEDYTINRKLGEGSYGIIFSVNKQNQKSPMYALKKIVAKTITEVSDFIKEFELVYLCDHPNIMKIYGICLRILDTTTFAIYVLMEKSKYDWNKEIKFYLSKRKTYSEKELINILRQLTEALLYLKNKLNISHRDIKPQNILIFDDGKYKLADFGEAKEVKISKKLNTLRGTELYMSPALYEGLKRDKNDVSHNPFKSDVFSLGFCFLVAAGLNFNLLYQVRDLTDNNVIEKAINTNLGKMYSHTFIEILCKMLQVDETKRFGFTEILDYLNNNYK